MTGQCLRRICISRQVRHYSRSKTLENCPSSARQSDMGSLGHFQWVNVRDAWMVCHRFLAFDGGLCFLCCLLQSLLGFMSQSLHSQCWVFLFQLLSNSQFSVGVSSLVSRIGNITDHIRPRDTIKRPDNDWLCQGTKSLAKLRTVGGIPQPSCKCRPQSVCKDGIPSGTLFKRCLGRIGGRLLRQGHTCVRLVA